MHRGLERTAIARKLVDIYRAEFNDQVKIIPLQGINSKDGMVARINAGLGISQTADEFLLFSGLTEKKRLIILDNLEDPLEERENRHPCLSPGLSKTGGVHRLLPRAAKP